MAQDPIKLALKLAQEPLKKKKRKHFDDGGGDDKGGDEKSADTSRDTEEKDTGDDTKVADTTQKDDNEPSLVDRALGLVSNAIVSPAEAATPAFNPDTQLTPQDLIVQPSPNQTLVRDPVTGELSVANPTQATGMSNELLDAANAEYVEQQQLADAALARAAATSSGDTTAELPKTDFSQFGQLGFASPVNPYAQGQMPQPVGITNPYTEGQMPQPTGPSNANVRAYRDAITPSLGVGPSDAALRLARDTITQNLGGTGGGAAVTGGGGAAQAMPTAGNVPTPPIPVRDIQGPSWAENVAGVFGLSTQQQLDKYYKQYTDQGLSPTDAYNKAIGDIQTGRTNMQSSLGKSGFNSNASTNPVPTIDPILATAAATTTPATTDTTFKLPGVNKPYVPPNAQASSTGTGYADLGANASALRQAQYTQAIKNALLLANGNQYYG